MAAIPPWIDVRPSDFLRAAEAGSQAGENAARISQAAIAEQARTTLQAQAEQNQLTEALAKLSQQERMAAMENEVRKDIATKAAMRQQQELEVDKARNEAMVGLGKARLQQAADISRAKAQGAAFAFADEQNFAKAVAGGMPVAAALYQFPRVRPAVISSLERAQGKESADIVPKEATVGGMDLIYNPKSGHFVPKGDKGPVANVPINPEQGTFGGTVRGPVSDPYIRSRMGTNAPPITATASSPAQKPVPKVTSKQEYDALPAGTVYIGKDGKRYRKPGPSDLSPAHTEE